jgi:Tn3 transposase DDE domain
MPGFGGFIGLAHEREVALSLRLKTIFLLRYLSDPELRYRVQSQLNRGGHRHSLARWIFFCQSVRIPHGGLPGDHEQSELLELSIQRHLGLVTRSRLPESSRRSGRRARPLPMKIWLMFPPPSSRDSKRDLPLPPSHRGGRLVVEYATVCFRSQKHFGPNGLSLPIEISH